MKICVISTPVFTIPVSGYSGLEHLAWLTAKGLAEKGHQVFLVAPDGSSCPGVTMIPCGPAGMVSEQQAYGGFGGGLIADGRGGQVYIRKIDGYWQQLLGVDCIIDESWGKFSYLLKAEGRLKAPVLGVCHAPINTMFQSLPNVDKPCFVCISEDQRQHFEALFSRPARTAYNGVDGDYYKPLGLPRSDRYLFLARFSTIKGPDLAIEACRKAEVGLDLIGDTQITNEPEFLDKCKKMCDGKRIRVIGPVSRGETVWWYSQAKALLHPNQRFREPFGLAPVEAMLGGAPVIAWNYGAMKETVKNGETGFLVNSLDEMTELIKTNAVDNVDRERCRKYAQQFSIERMVNRYEELCKEAIETGGW